MTGRVQGVFFRDECRRRARREDVAGSVTNAPDGSVRAVFEGEHDAVDRMVEWCRRGPSGADVASIDVEDQEPQGEEAFGVG